VWLDFILPLKFQNEMEIVFILIFSR